MAIQEGNITLLKSQVMGDVPEGGGRATGTPIADGASNSIFSDISELDRAYGRVNLAKTFVSVDTPDTDGYFGANVIIAASPVDSRVSCTLFTTMDGFDRRVDAQSWLESYVVAGPLSAMQLYGDQLEGQRAVSVIQRTDAALPEVGQVIALSDERTAVPVRQFVRITKIDATNQTFEDKQGVFTRTVMTLAISDRLRRTFLGDEAMRYSATLATFARVRTTTVADTAKYYGASALAQPVTLGALALKIHSIYTPLVPSSQLETPIVLGEIAGASRIVAAGMTIVLPATTWGGYAKTLYLRGQVTPNTLALSIGAANGYWPKTDNGMGDIILPSGVVVGSIDYANGTLTPDTSQANAWGNTGSAAITYTPGTAVVQSSFTHCIAVTLATRGLVYVQTMTPHPAPGTLMVDYMALGKWYRLQDNGMGVLAGADSGTGTGSVNYATGGVVVTLGALPDVDSAIMFGWGSAVDTRVRTAGTSAMTMEMVTAHGTAERNSVSVEYTKGGVKRRLTDSGTGTLRGAGEAGKDTGTVKYATGEIVIDGGRDPGTDVVLGYAYGSPLSSQFNDPPRNASGGTVTLALEATPILPRSVRLIWNTIADDYVTSRIDVDPIMIAADDGAGGLIFANGDAVGTIDYVTGVITWMPDVVVSAPRAVYSSRTTGVFTGKPTTTLTYSHTEYVRVPARAPVDFDATVTYRSTDSATTVEEILQPALRFELVPDSGEQVLPNGLCFTLGTSNYVDRGGVLYRDASLTTGGGIEAGSIDYSSTVVAVTSWPAALSASPLSVKSCLTVLNGRKTLSATFRTAGAPIRSASLYVQATAADGALLTATANAHDEIVGTGISGTVNSITGVVALAFGAIVTAAGNEAAWWYDATLVVDGKIWQPIEVLPGTIRYNAVVVSSLPLEANIIGLDPVRLPSDGRVPIFRAGDIAVVHHTETKAAQTVKNGQTVVLRRSRLSRVRVLGSNGVEITTGYSANLDAGSVTFNDIADYVQPISIENRIEDMALVSDAQINGSLTLTRQLTHDFPLGSYVSSALIIGDMKARVPLLFDQNTWDNTFKDVVVGSVATPTFNDVLAPVEVTNAGAITERWAVRFTNTTAFEVIGEHVGVIATGNTANDCMPNNPATGAPYFAISAIGWGSGWAAGNVLRLNTIGALHPVWIVRTIQQGPATALDDAFTVLVRGDIDRP